MLFQGDRSKRYLWMGTKLIEFKVSMRERIEYGNCLKNATWITNVVLEFSYNSYYHGFRVLELNRKYYIFQLLAGDA